MKPTRTQCKHGSESSHNVDYDDDNDDDYDDDENNQDDDSNGNYGGSKSVHWIEIEMMVALFE